MYSVELFELFDKCGAAGLRLSVSTEGSIIVTPRELLTDALRTELRERKADVICAIHPHLTPQGELVIPFRSPAKYRWWQGGQSTVETMRELGATAEQMTRHEMPDLSNLVEPIETVRERWKLLRDGKFKRANITKWRQENAGRRN